ncbi:helix-turn-helix transcriptional regulator [Deinococcus sp. HMF7604]|uniref:helix-turn-helix domain-containing protein n=1 Tax=Deinococcus betulae TaxID=2873312 RepID=UPI001CCA9AAA|nr:helix-turn-helix transcriptional regulator [Deinococcus betulae]MBZ9752813.1 helix-turn-helix transcriptional regulator [Deinococcus betulae]
MKWSDIETTLKAAIREKRGAQSEIARRLGIKPGSVANYVSGSNSIPTPHLDTILTVMGMTLHLGDASTVDIRNFLIQMSEQPDQQFFDSSGQGRHVYHYGETEIAGVTDLVWYSPGLWWVKLRHPKFRAHTLGTLQHTGETVLADTYHVLDGPFKGYGVAVSANLIHLWAPGLPGTPEHPAPYLN